MSSEFSTSRFTQGGSTTKAPSHDPKHKLPIREQIIGLKVPDDNEVAVLMNGAGLPVPVAPAPAIGGGPGSAQDVILAKIQKDIERRRMEEGTTPPSGFKSPGYGQEPANTPVDRPSMRTLNADTPVIPVPILCNATDCKWNKERACTATSITVSAKGAKCETYEKRPTKADLRSRKKIRKHDLINTRRGPAIVVQRENNGYRVVYPDRKQKIVPFKKYEVMRKGVDFSHLLV